jgi:hypothetical protein
VFNLHPLVVIELFIAYPLNVSPPIEFRVLCKITQMANDGNHLILEAAGRNSEAKAASANDAKVGLGNEDRIVTWYPVERRENGFRGAYKGKFYIDPSRTDEGMSEIESVGGKGVRAAKTYSPMKEATRKGKLRKVPRRLIICCKPLK